MEAIFRENIKGKETTILLCPPITDREYNLEAICFQARISTQFNIPIDRRFNPILKILSSVKKDLLKHIEVSISVFKDPLVIQGFEDHREIQVDFILNAHQTQNREEYLQNFYNNYCTIGARFADALFCLLKSPVYLTYLELVEQNADVKTLERLFNNFLKHINLK